MSDEDNFIARWSRLKREAAQGKAADAAPDAPEEAPEREARAAPPQSAAEGPQDTHRQPEPPIDPASLPPIEEIVADSDITVYLKKGVPAELTKAALRRAWSADPEIRDFIGLVESQWDFADPTAMPGFGPLKVNEDLHKLVSQAIGELPEAPEQPAEKGREAAVAAKAGGPPEPAAQESAHEPFYEPAHEPAAQEPVDDRNAVAAATSPQHSEPAGNGGTLPGRRGHGRALPR